MSRALQWSKDNPQNPKAPERPSSSEELVDSLGQVAIPEKLEVRRETCDDLRIAQHHWLICSFSEKSPNDFSNPMHRLRMPFLLSWPSSTPKALWKLRCNRIRIRQPKRNMQKKLVRSLSNGNEFVAYVDAIGHLDGKRRLLEWKTTSARYPEQPEGLTSLDLQHVCYSWITGISDVAIVAFVRKRVPEIQYLQASITEEQRQEFGELVDATARQIETAQFPSHPGIRFPQNGCVSCAHLGLCLGNELLAGAKLIRQPGANDLD